MKPEEQRIAIAEACGWKLEDGTTLSGVPYKVWIKGVPTSKASAEAAYRVDELPDYLNDLDAMHEAEKTLDVMQQRNYVSNLTSRSFVQDSDITRLNCWNALHATAAQRAEAFLRTIGKWKD